MARLLPPDLRRAQCLCALLLALAAAGGCSRDTAPPRIVVLSPELVRVLADLGIADAVVAADDRSCAAPGLKATCLGPFDEEMTARAAALHPGVVLAIDRDPERRVAEELGTRGARVERCDPRTLDEVVAAIRQIGVAVGREERAHELTDRMRIDIAKTAMTRDGRPRLKVLWLLDHSPRTVVGTVGLLHDVLELAGAENALHGVGTPRAVLGDTELAELRYDTLVDSSAPDAAGAHVTTGGNADAITLRLPPQLSALPAFDIAERVHLLHDSLYPAATAGD